MVTVNEINVTHDPSNDMCYIWSSRRDQYNRPVYEHIQIPFSEVQVLIWKLQTVIGV